jgi:hypothetical protein
MPPSTPHDLESVLDQRVTALRSQGVIVVDARQTFVDADVELSRIQPGAVLHPGTRLHGARTWIAQGAEIGREGPVVLRDSVLGPGARVDSGFVHGAVLLAGASLGANAHVREGTLLEEGASTAHAVGLKQSILLAFVTVGSNVNLCDMLMTGGRSRDEHSEVGSGFIHFNYTPWGKRGDKATPSRFGSVPGGVLLREPRIFLGGAGGVVGPRFVGFGSVVAAGQVLRRDVDDGRVVLDPPRHVDRDHRDGALDDIEPRASKNVAYVADLIALRAWYREARLVRAAPGPERVLVQEAQANLDRAIDERLHRLRAFLLERGVTPRPLHFLAEPPPPVAIAADGAPHVDWVRALDDGTAKALHDWLEDLTERSTRTMNAALLGT